jgi:hypothetical protein
VTKAALERFWEAYSAFVAAFRGDRRQAQAGDRTVRFPLGSFPPALPFVSVYVACFEFASETGRGSLAFREPKPVSNCLEDRPAELFQPKTRLQAAATPSSKVGWEEYRRSSISGAAFLLETSRTSSGAPGSLPSGRRFPVKCLPGWGLSAT